MRAVSAATLACAFSALACYSGDAAAALQMYKCIVAGRTVYQQAACAADAEPAPAAASAALRAAPTAVPAKTASGIGKPASAGVKPLRPGAAPASSVPARPR